MSYKKKLFSKIYVYLYWGTLYTDAHSDSTLRFFNENFLLKKKISFFFSLELIKIKNNSFYLNFFCLFACFFLFLQTQFNNALSIIWCYVLLYNDHVSIVH